MSITTYLPADRVRVVRNGQLYPWTPPGAAPTADRAVGANNYSPLHSHTTMSSTAKATRGGRPATASAAAVICVGRTGKEVRYPSITAAAKATGMATKAIYNQCVRRRTLKHPGKWARLVFRFAEVGV